VRTIAEGKQWCADWMAVRGVRSRGWPLVISIADWRKRLSQRPLLRPSENTNRDPDTGHGTLRAENFFMDMRGVRNAT